MTTNAATNILRLWDHIYGDGTDYVCVASGLRPSPDSRAPLEQFTERYFPYPIAAANAAQWLITESERGREAYFCAHLLTGKKRVKPNAAPILALYADIDGGRVPEAYPPTALVQSSPGRFQGYWRLTRPIPPFEAEALNRRIAQATGADPSGYDLTQLLRPPGTFNFKYADSPPVCVIALDDEGGAA